jgi:hypothetical protein
VKVLNGEIEYIDLHKTREQDPRLEGIQKLIQRRVIAQEKQRKELKLNRPRKLIICFEEIRVCPKVYPALKEILTSFKDNSIHFILLKDEMLEKKQRQALIEKD